MLFCSHLDLPHLVSYLHLWPADVSDLFSFFYLTVAALVKRSSGFSLVALRAWKFGARSGWENRPPIYCRLLTVSNQSANFDLWPPNIDKAFFSPPHNCCSLDLRVGGLRPTETYPDACFKQEVVFPWPTEVQLLDWIVSSVHDDSVGFCCFLKLRAG